MRLEIDFSKTDEIIIAEGKKAAEKIERDDEFLNELFEYSKLYDSQFEHKANKGKVVKLYQFFKTLREIAWTNSGCAIIEISDDMKLGVLEYTGEGLLITSVPGNIAGDFLVSLLRNYSDMSIYVIDGLLHIKIVTHLYDKIQVCNKSKELEQLRKKYKERRDKRRKKRNETE